MKIGDAVQLKTGSPVMSVEKIINRPDGSVDVCCVWFNQHGDCKRDDFLAELLVRVNV